MKLFTVRQKELTYEAYDFIKSKQEKVNELLKTNKEVELIPECSGLKITSIRCGIGKTGQKLIQVNEQCGQNLTEYNIPREDWCSFSDDIIDYLGL